jgi:hypothetical protein
MKIYEKRRREEKSMSTMIILEETNSQMVPSALSKRMTENRKENFFCVLS